MKLYHYTTSSNAILIVGIGDKGIGSGLQPHLTEHGTYGPMQTMCQPVVWLTKAENNLATPEYIAHLSQFPGNEDLKVGEPMYGGPVQCIVNVERSRHVMRWTEFMHTTPDGRDVFNNYDMPPSFTTGWWISLKTIPLSRIIVPLTREQAVEGCEWQIKQADNASLKQRWTQKRDTFATTEPGTLFVFHNGECMQRISRKHAETVGQLSGAVI